MRSTGRTQLLGVGNTTVVHNLAATVTVTGSADAQALFEGTERPSSMPFGTSASAGSTTAVEPTSVPWHPMPRLRGRGLWQRSQRSLAPFLQDADVTSEHHREAECTERQQFGSARAADP